MNLDSLLEGLIPDTETLSISNLPFAVRNLPFCCSLDCREQQNGRLAATLRANFTTKLTLKFSRNRRKKSREINPKNPAKFVSFFSAKYQKAWSFYKCFLLFFLTATRNLKLSSVVRAIPHLFPVSFFFFSSFDSVVKAV